jgi:hypothetical protein
MLGRHNVSKAVAFETSFVFSAAYVILRRWEKSFQLLVKCNRNYFYLFLSLTWGRGLMRDVMRRSRKRKLVDCLPFIFLKDCTV